MAHLAWATQSHTHEDIEAKCPSQTLGVIDFRVGLRGFENGFHKCQHIVRHLLFQKAAAAL